MHVRHKNRTYNQFVSSCILVMPISVTFTRILCVLLDDVPHGQIYLYLLQAA